MKNKKNSENKNKNDLYIFHGTRPTGYITRFPI